MTLNNLLGVPLYMYHLCLVISTHILVCIWSRIYSNYFYLYTFWLKDAWFHPQVDPPSSAFCTLPTTVSWGAPTGMIRFQQGTIQLYITAVLFYCLSHYCLLKSLQFYFTVYLTTVYCLSTSLLFFSTTHGHWFHFPAHTPFQSSLCSQYANGS